MAHTWRSVLFGVDGWKHYLKAGYEAKAKHFDNAALSRDLSHVHVMVTGANQGIGYATCKQMATQKAHVYMVCRSRERGEAALAKLEAEVGGDGDDNIELHVCDISSMAAVKALADSYVSGGKPLHCLVNNAGCMVHERTQTPEGIEANFATNTLGTWALTEGLLPALHKTAGSKVVSVASAGMLTELLELKDMEMKNGKFDGTVQYAKNKRHQVALTQRWARLHGSGAADAAKAGAGGGGEGSEAGVGFYSMHPGWSDTEAVKTALPGFYASLKARLRSPAEGADTVAWLCAVPRSQLKEGGFYLDRQTVPVHVSTGYFTGTQYTEAEVDQLAAALKERFESVTAAVAK
mmetsp:Transcript_7425/g.18900  ORF Transcript_7425/g.18900 Transcript_7425/m.18900 type:complete len:350 (+) Transcript_7425:214-1263(+)